MVSPLHARRWARRPWRKALIGWLVPNACLGLGSPWLNLRFSLARKSILCFTIVCCRLFLFVCLFCCFTPQVHSHGGTLLEQAVNE